MNCLLDREAYGWTIELAHNPPQRIAGALRFTQEIRLRFDKFTQQYRNSVVNQLLS